MSGEVQPFPTGRLAKNSDWSLSALRKWLLSDPGEVRSYIVKSVRMDSTSQCFEQHGSGPNFQGGLLTLCTCKHQMRTSLNCATWPGTWIAGFTSRCIHKRRHWLFFLTRIANAYESHAELWESLSETTRRNKSAQNNFLGDVFVPRGKVTGGGRFDPRRYYQPSRHSHRQGTCDTGWRNDIDYWYADRYGPPWLLVGDPQLTFIWEKPVIRLDADHCRNFRKWASIDRLLRHLRETP